MASTVHVSTRLTQRNMKDTFVLGRLVVFDPHPREISALELASQYLPQFYQLVVFFLAF